MYLPAIEEYGKVIESLFKELYKEYFPQLPYADKEKVLNFEKGKDKSIDKFTIGEWIGLFREAHLFDFVKAKKRLDKNAIFFGYGIVEALKELRNRVAHENEEHLLDCYDKRALAYFMESAVLCMLQELGILPETELSHSPTKAAAQPSREQVENIVYERHTKRPEFWTRLLEQSKKKTPLFANISPSNDSWLSAGAGISGVAYQYLILRDKARIQLAIQGSDAFKNKKMFDELYKRREQIEKDFGDRLVWERLDDRISSRISKTIENKGLRDVEEWPTIVEKMVEAMVRLEKTLNKHLKQMR
jgi:hypothetical protein